MKTNVLIIGAGPTGLMAACQLRRLGIDCMVIDKKQGPTIESRALVVHARTLEIYEQMGIASTATADGEVLNKIQFLVKGKKIQELSLGTLGEGQSQFPYLLIFEQSKNEQLLYHCLKDSGGDVQWQTELLSVKEEDGVCTVELRDQQNSYTVEAGWVVAADGAKSTARHYLNVPFEGNTYEHIFYVADSFLNWQWGHKAVSLYLSRETFIALLPMKGEEHYRAIGILPKAFQNQQPENFETIIPLIQETIETDLPFRDTQWFSVYKLHHRCVKDFRKGRVFFAGDSAHVHSPVGGQGMNTGLQDAYNLAWKMAYVVKGYAAEKLLDSYNQERLPFAKQLVASTDRAFSVVTSTKWYDRLLRIYAFPKLVPFIFKFKKFRRRAFKTISQIGIRYIDSDLTLNRMASSIAVKAGERFPFLKNKEGETIYSLMKEGCFYALVFQINPDQLYDQMSLVASRFPFLRLIDLSEEKDLAEALKIKNNILILVRPDHYIALVTDEGAKVAGDYLQNIMSA